MHRSITPQAEKDQKLSWRGIKKQKQRWVEKDEAGWAPDRKYNEKSKQDREASQIQGDHDEAELGLGFGPRRNTCFHLLARVREIFRSNAAHPKQNLKRQHNSAGLLHARRLDQWTCGGHSSDWIASSAANIFGQQPSERHSASKTARSYGPAEKAVRICVQEKRVLWSVSRRHYSDNYKPAAPHFDWVATCRLRHEHQSHARSA